jgi:hypothetical protein
MIFGMISVTISIVLFLCLFFGQDFIEEDKTIIVIDRSLSMLADDVSSSGKNISRLDRAKSLAKQSFSKETAIITYAKEADIISPFTTDRETLSSIIDRISPALVSGGSDLGHALELIHTLYGELLHLRVIIYSDGGSTEKIKSPLLPRSWDILIVGIWGEALVPIPLWYDAIGSTRYKYASWKIVEVRYEEENIWKYARATWARVIHEDSYTPKEKSLVSRNTLLLTASFLLLFWLLCHPYVRFSK